MKKSMDLNCMVRLSAVLALVGILCIGTGCELDRKSSGGNDFRGTWALYQGSAVGGTPYWYVHFQPDETFFISNAADGSGVRVSGTYTVSSGKLTGPFTNPGTGEGRVEATIQEGILKLDFIEYWHTPHKVIPFSGSKL
ncbi:MAG: hypothetical protein JJU29_23280 [Verrucomicrobia bacterium]|nr:hypothetical protein [Verrucomicrobiota bacterium]MCH8514188.1 hypothetical protein [Kiritimatiellia bacterium]